MPSSAIARGMRYRKARRGNIIVLAAFLLVILITMLALSIDAGYMYTMKTELDRSVDAAALAGTSALIDGETAAQDMVVEYLVRNPIGRSNTIVTEATLTTLKSDWLTEHQEELQLTYGYWNPETHQMELSFDPTAVKVVVARAEMPLFFARAIGHDRFTVLSSSIATYKPRDIMLVLDLSASMNDDSELKSIGSLGRDWVEDSLRQIYSDLDTPVYGTMTLPPEYITVVGQTPASDDLPQITVEYRGTSVEITSTKEISHVLLELGDGTTLQNGGFQAGAITTTISAGQTILRIWVVSGANAAYWVNTNGNGEPFDFAANATFVNALGLTNVPYPYPSGSWDDYVTYARSPDTPNSAAGYQYKFGYLNLVNYWLERQPAHDQTPALNMVTAQPLATVKDAIDLFVDYVREVNTRDRVGLAVYNSASGGGSLEVSLTFDLDQAVTAAQGKQAGHYHSMTNIGGGLGVANDQLQQAGRDGAFKMIVLLTDGGANYVDGTNDPAGASSYAIAEATRSSALKYKVMTITLGAGADTSLMQQIADIADGVHFNVPGGGTVNETRDGLINAFREIARKRPVMLVE